MDPFSPAHQPDEGYSEDPLAPAVSESLSAELASLRWPAEFPAWLARHASTLPLSVKQDLTLMLLDDLPTSAIAEIVQRLNPRLYIDFVVYLPAEICLKVMGYLDPVSLVGVAQTCRAWYDLALDRKLWERLYYLEGWKSIPREIESCEIKINAKFNSIMGHLHRMEAATHPKHEARAVRIKDENFDEDFEMHDYDRQSRTQGEGTAESSSVFGPSSPSPASQDTAMEASSGSGPAAYKGKGVDWSFASSDVIRVKRKEPGGSPEPSLPPTVMADDPDITLQSALWAWDISSSRYRLNWKYLYDMRRRLESNWELGKYTTFQLPHPNHPEEGHQECVYSLQFDATYLVSGSRDQTMRIWNVRTRRLVRQPLVGHAGSVLCLQFDASPENDILVSGSSDSNVFIWRFSTGEIMQKLTNAHRESVLNVRFDHRILVTSSKDKTIKIFNRRPLRFGETGYPTGEEFNPAGQSVKRYGFEPDLAHELPVKEPFTMIGRLEGHGAAVNAIQVLDRTIVSVSGDRQIKVWDWPDQVCIQTIPAHDKGIACVEFDGRRIVSGSSDYEVCIFDAPTGLKVAQLRGHAHLVRTVQAGFGDPPYSKLEDAAEAKVVDAEYFKAIQAGEINFDGGERRNRRGRLPNAGSSRPADLQAFGAKVPPGGGGGRKYGRIVSGSYDQSIIIWRRDKEGVWKPAHHLRQEEAALAAQRRMSGPSASPLVATYTQGGGSLLPPTQLPDGISSLSHQMHGSGHQTSGGETHGPTLELQEAYRNLIDQIVPQGARALEEALASHPTLLSHHSYLQSVIEGEHSPLIRMRLRQVVTAALVAVQTEQQLRQRPGSHAASHSTGDSDEAPSTALGWKSPSSRPAAMRLSDATMGPQHAMGLSPVVAAVSGSAFPGRVPSHPAMPSHQAHHPHMTMTESPPARIFKLQFDARKIVCCSQAPVIVGWDFCNGDAELEETSRFFATVD